MVYRNLSYEIKEKCFSFLQTKLMPSVKKLWNLNLIFFFFLAFWNHYCLTTLTLFLNIPGFLATGVILGSTKFLSGDVTVAEIVFFFCFLMKDAFWTEENFHSHSFEMKLSLTGFTAPTVFSAQNILQGFTSFVGFFGILNQSNTLVWHIVFKGEAQQIG